MGPQAKEHRGPPVATGCEEAAGRSSARNCDKEHRPCQHPESDVQPSELATVHSVILSQLIFVPLLQWALIQKVTRPENPEHFINRSPQIKKGNEISRDS